MVRIHNIRTGKKYVAYHENECRDDTDKSLFRTCVQLNTTINMGEMVAEKIR